MDQMVLVLWNGNISVFTFILNMIPAKELESIFAMCVTGNIFKICFALKIEQYLLKSSPIINFASK